jgi:hypothetical protein
MEMTDSIFSSLDEVFGSGPVVDAVDVGLYGTWGSALDTMNENEAYT